MGKMELCYTCALKLQQEREIRQTGYARRKITCGLCGRRRYGIEYELGPADGEKNGRAGRKNKCRP